jgi:hypothetical protein
MVAAPKELRRLAGTLALPHHGQDARATFRLGRSLALLDYRFAI